MYTTYIIYIIYNSNFLWDLISYTKQINRQRKNNFIFIGDFNFPLINWLLLTKDKMGKQYLPPMHFRERFPPAHQNKNSFCIHVLGLLLTNELEKVINMEFVMNLWQSTRVSWKGLRMCNQLLITLAGALGFLLEIPIYDKLYM